MDASTSRLADDCAVAVVEAVRPLSAQCDERVFAVLQSQQVLDDRITELTNKIASFSGRSDAFPDLAERAAKLAAMRSTLQEAHRKLTSAQARLQRVQSELSK